MAVVDIKEKFVSVGRDGETLIWLTKRLWELSKNLPVYEFEIASFGAFDKDVWFGDKHQPTVNKVLEHYRRIEKATFEFPIIVGQDGTILDGVHRICRAHLDGRKTIPAVKFVTDPAPDQRRPINE